MTSALDVAALIRSRGVSDQWVVQKVLYYCQAWSLAWDGEPMFAERLEAWRDGPVCPAVQADRASGQPNALSPRQLDTFNAVFRVYGAKSKEWLVNLTHRERPWIEARGGALPSEKTSGEISPEVMKAFYAPLSLGKGFSDAYREELEFLAHEPDGLPPIESDTVVDGSAFLRWLDSGEGTPWVADPRGSNAG